MTAAQIKAACLYCETHELRPDVYRPKPKPKS